MSNDEKRKGPAETEVEALRSMLEQRGREPHTDGPNIKEWSLQDTVWEKTESREETTDEAAPPAEETE